MMATVVEKQTAADAAAAAAAAADLFADDFELTNDLAGEAGEEDGTCVDPKMLFVKNSAENTDKAMRLVHQRLAEGQGEFILQLGSPGGETSSSLTGDQLALAEKHLERVAALCGATSTLLRRWKEGGSVSAEFLLRKQADEEDFMEIRVAVVGNVDAGKSTLLGVLTHGELDNGRGLARQKLFRHKHEMESGRTSSVGNDILGFDSDGKVVNKSETHGSGLDWARICRESSKVITFIDLAGHERYLKTTVFGMTGHAPDFCMLMVGSNAGVVGMTKEHLGLALALNVPVFVVVTKIDMCPANVLQDTLKMLMRILKSPGCRKIPLMVNTTDDVVLAATNFVTERMCPLFQVSNVTGHNLDLLKMFLNLLSTRMGYREEAPAEFQIDDTYSVPGVGTVVAGTTLCGVIRKDDTLLLGPDSLGHFQPCTIKSIQRKRMPVREVRGGQTATFALKKVKRKEVRKGMVMVSRAVDPRSCWEFQGEILVLHHPTTISARYQAMVHCGSVRQTASILHMSRDNLRTGDKATCHFRFIKNPEYLREGARLVFREGRTKAVGHVSKLMPHAPGPGPRGAAHRAKSTRQTPSTAAAHSEGSEATAHSAGIEEKSGETEPKGRRGRGGAKHKR